LEVLAKLLAWRGSSVKPNDTDKKWLIDLAKEEFGELERLLRVRTILGKWLRTYSPLRWRPGERQYWATWFKTWRPTGADRYALWINRRRDMSQAMKVGYFSLGADTHDQQQATRYESAVIRLLSRPGLGIYLRWLCKLLALGDTRELSIEGSRKSDKSNLPPGYVSRRPGWLARYNAACFYSQLMGTASGKECWEKERPRYADAALKQLARVVRAPYSQARMQWFVTDPDLADLRNDPDYGRGWLRFVGIGADRQGKIEWQRLERALQALPMGAWTTYRDLAELLNSDGARPVGSTIVGEEEVWNYLASHGHIVNAHRVLPLTGVPLSSRTWADTAHTIEIRTLLVRDGVLKTPDDAALSDCRYDAQQLSELIE
jgi:hypothetical protein